MIEPSTIEDIIFFLVGILGGLFLVFAVSVIAQNRSRIRMLEQEVKKLSKETK